MYWISLLITFIITYIEIFLFVQVSHVLGVLTTLLLIIASSFVGLSLMHTQGMRILGQIQITLTQGESPAGEMIKNISILLTGLLLLIPGFFTDFFGLLLLLPPIQKLLTLRLLTYLRFQRSAVMGTGETFEGEFSRKKISHDHLDDHSNGAK
ncbi:MAG: protein FxsA [Sodalis sp. Fse]|nr:MAG: protein FxsA [Sodalis sp. Fse]